MNSITVARVGRKSPAQVAHLVLGLFKLRIAVMIMITTLVGLAVTPGTALSLTQVVVLALAVLLASASAGAFNQYFEFDTDRLTARTRTRAFVTGDLPHTPVWLVLLAALYVFLGAFVYAVVYTVWLKRRCWTNIVVGGLAGSFAVLAGGAAVDPALEPLPLLLAFALFLWTPPHFWSLAIANQADYAAAGVPMLPVVVGSQRAACIVFASTVALVVASLLPGLFGAGPVYLAGALVGGAHFLHKAHALARAPSRKTAMASFFASLLHLSLLLGAASIDGLMR